MPFEPRRPTSPGAMAKASSSLGDSGENGDDDKGRIALGITYRRHQLEPLLSAIATGVQQQPVVLISRQLPQDMEPLFRFETEDRTGLRPIMVHYSDGEIDAGPGASVPEPALALCAQLRRFDTWMTPGLALRLKRHMERHALIIAVPLCSRTQEQTICRLLLSRAEAGLFIHDTPG